jgi:hypothetical protein
MATRPRGPSTVRTGDLVLIGAGAAVFALAFGALVGIGVASYLFGRGWAWPHGVLGAVHELAGLLTGNPGGVAVWAFVVLVELFVLALATILARLVRETVRPPDARAGLATRGEAASALGRRRLTRQRAAEIRPDLHGDT